MFFRSYVFLFIVCLNIDFARQSHMRYKARSIILSRRLARAGVPDLSLLPIAQKLAVFGSLGITFGPRDTSSL
jgi:hypothetical protein